MYARKHIPEYWVIGLPTGEVHQFWDPDDTGFAEHRVVPLTGELRSATMRDLAIDGRGIF
jgi:hypothetical protein